MTVEQLLSECDLVRLTEEKLAACKPFSCGEGDLDEFFFALFLGGLIFILYLCPLTHIVHEFQQVAIPVGIQDLRVKDILEKRTFTNVIFDIQISQIKASEENATERPRWVYYTLPTPVVKVDQCNISRRGLTRVAYPDARQCESPDVG